MSKRRIRQPRCVLCGRFRKWEQLRLHSFVPDSEEGPEEILYECRKGKGCRADEQSLPSLLRIRKVAMQEVRDYRR